MKVGGQAGHGLTLIAHPARSPSPSTTSFGHVRPIVTYQALVSFMGRTRPTDRAAGADRGSMPCRRSRRWSSRRSGCRALLVGEAELGERIMRALILRRTSPCCGCRAQGPIIIGRPVSGDVLRLERLPRPQWLSVPDAGRGHGSGGARADRALPDRGRRPADRALPRRANCCATRLKGSWPVASGISGGSIPRPGSTTSPSVGAGPAGLAASVYAASEGLKRAGARLRAGPLAARRGRLRADRELSRFSDRHHRNGADGAGS